jgi:ABC-type Na+ transport system ATPase subunit NatA
MSGAALPLEDEVRRLLDAGVCGVVALISEAGTGKTTALQHLAAVLPPDAGIILLDECAQIGIFGSGRVVC